MNSPVGVAFTLDGDPDYIYVGYNPTSYPSDLTAPNAYDNHVALLVGNDMAAASLVVVPDDSFARVAGTLTYQMPYIVGLNGFTNAVAPVFRHAIPVAGTGGTDVLRARPLVLLPRTVLDLALRTQGAGRFTILGFHTDIITPFAAGTPAEQAPIAPLEECFRLMVLDAAGGGGPVVQLAAVTTANPIAQQALQRHRHSVTSLLLGRLGVGGPGLSNAAFNVGVAAIQTAMTDTNADQLE